MEIWQLNAEIFYRTGKSLSFNDTPRKYVICQLRILQTKMLFFLRVTSPILEESFDVIKAWGFEHKTSFIWDKIKHNMGHYLVYDMKYYYFIIKGAILFKQNYMIAYFL